LIFASLELEYSCTSSHLTLAIWHNLCLVYRTHPTRPALSP
jgi:hypothetical protein